MNSPRGAKGITQSEHVADVASSDVVSNETAPEEAPPSRNPNRAHAAGENGAGKAGTSPPDGTPGEQVKVMGQGAGGRKQVMARGSVPAALKQQGLPVEVPQAPVPAHKRPGKGPGRAPGLSSVSTAPVPPARAHRRHKLLFYSFILLVLLPAAGIFYYLYEHAQDRYASTAAFFVHREDTTPSVETMFGIPGVGGGGSTPDADVLYQFIQSQQMVEVADRELDLRRIYSPAYDVDPVFALPPDATLEDLVAYWNRVVSMVFAPDTGLITLEVVAFDPNDARAISRVILAESAQLIDDLSQISQADSITEAQQDLTLAEQRLKTARVAVAEFRSSSQFVDPTAVVAGAEGVINALEQRLATEMIDRDTLIGTTTRDDDPRIERADRVIEAIRQRIADERSSVGTDQAVAVGSYEELLVDRQFAEQAYTAALAAYDAAVAEARRKSRYLATHINPTLAASPIYPDRVVLGMIGTAFLFMAWAVLMLVLYSIRDRR